jgi:hypothetical protein
MEVVPSEDVDALSDYSIDDQGVGKLPLLNL